MSILRRIGRIFLYLLAGFGGLSLVLIGGLIVFGLLAREEVETPDKIIVSIDLSGGVVEREKAGILSGFNQHRGLVLRKTVTTIDQAERDPRVKGLVLELGTGNLSIVHAQALRRALLKFRESGKFVHGFAQDFGGTGNGTVSYYLASAADRIWMQPSGTLGFIGLAVEAPFFAGALEKLDVKVRNEQRHEYKSAGESFVRSGFSPEARESLQGLVNSWIQQITADIAVERSMSAPKLNALMEEGPFISREAKDAGLVDVLAYRDEFEEEVQSFAGEAATWVSVQDYREMLPPTVPAKSRVALIYGQGAIVAGKGSGSPIGNGRQFAADKVAAAIQDAVDDPEISAILLRIDSPGGAYGPSDMVWRAVHVARKAGKPVVASLGRTAASGGYFVAMASDKIVAEPGTVTGSIGVLTLKFVTRDFWRKWGVEWDRVQSNSRTAIWGMVDDYPPGASERVSAILDAVYTDFTEKVARDRGYNADQIDSVARGRVWTGAEAKKIGLVDELGGFETAMSEVRKLLDVPAEEPLDILQLPKPSRLEEMVKALRQQGIDIDAPITQIRSAMSPTSTSVMERLAEPLALLTPPVGVLQMPTWRIAR